ncbi:MAG: glutamine synthetase III [Candidatus Altiarchaeota archaeon]
MVKKGGEDKIPMLYGENVFGLKAMSKFLPKKVLDAVKDTMEKGKPIPEGIADDVAEGMKKWAISKGATHYTHWFQPMTSMTAEKHDAFVEPTKNGDVIMKFSGKNLIQGEPDASSFPSGGLRPTFEARGYTVWDPTSPAFIKDSEDGPTLAIPTAFMAYTGDSIDKKTPLLRSMQALDKSVKRFIKLLDGKVADKRSYPTLGPEQEYFLVDKELYLSRPDLMLTGRTLFGSLPSRHQQMEDHYFTAIKPRVLRFMQDVDTECWKLGIPAKTRHNEVAPAQFELAPVFEDLNLSVDHNMLLMEILKETADKHGLVCLLHEKPFAGINGSGKHNNWSVTSPAGKNLMKPGETPHQNAKFLTVVAAVMMAVDKHAKLLRAAVATAGNDHRLGANEAPPAILSIFLGEQLTDIIEQIEKGGAKTSKASETVRLGVTTLPEFPKDVTDRNRTSPFAFTGNKFEFRAVGSNQSCAGANTVLNVAFAEALDHISDKLEEALSKNKNKHEALQEILQEVVKKHKRILFNGDNYTKEWEREAEKRGLPNIKTSDEALKAIISKETIEVMGKYDVLSKKELEARYEINMENYVKTIDLEGKTALDMAQTMILPVALKHQRNLAKTVRGLKHAGVKPAASRGVKAELDKVSYLVSRLIASIKGLEKSVDDGKTRTTIRDMIKLREVVDELERTVDDALWPLPKYRELLFVY